MFSKNSSIATAIVLLLMAIGSLANGNEAWIILGGTLAVLIIGLFLRE